MFCSKCGAAIPDTASVCPVCAQPTGGVAVPAYGGSYGATAVPHVAYAGFWLRFVAWIIDSLVLQVVLSFVLIPFFGHSVIREILHGHQISGPEDLLPLLAGIWRMILIQRVLEWLYYALTESSAWQATLGKKALGLRVTDLQGERVSFGRATGRYFARIITHLTFFIGYIMAGFTEKKQALHDVLAGCLVVRQE
jgi:uncharacterized RDD family membrane protein YckC